MESLKGLLRKKIIVKQFRYSIFNKPLSHFSFCISSDGSVGKAEVRCQLKAHNEADCLSGRKIRPVIAQGPVMPICILMLQSPPPYKRWCFAYFYFYFFA